MLALQEISIFSKDFCSQVFGYLFNPALNKEDEENILNFLLIPYEEAYKEFIFKVNHLNILDEKIFFVYDSGNNLIGYATIFPNRWNSYVNNEAEFGLFIKKDQRNKGYGTELIDQLEQYTKKYLPNIDTAILSPTFFNEKATKLYEKLGYEHEPNSLALSQNMLYLIKDIKSYKKIEKEGKRVGVYGSGDLDSYLIGLIFKAVRSQEKVIIFDFCAGKESRFQKIQDISQEIQLFSFDPSDYNELKSGFSLLMRSFLSFDTVVVAGVDRINHHDLRSELVMKWLRDEIPKKMDVIVSGYTIPAIIHEGLDMGISINIDEIYD